ncbi:MAG: Bbp16 family capsid cement protein [Candidatus Avigastranaerophilus sp.]
MILDEQTLFSDNQKITANSASTNILDFGKSEMSFGTPVTLFIQVTEDFDKLTSLKITVQTSVVEAFTSPVDLIDQTITLENLKKGMVSAIKFLPKGNLGYMRLYYTVTGTTPSQGAVFAGIADSLQESFHNI